MASNKNRNIEKQIIDLRPNFFCRINELKDDRTLCDVTLVHTEWNGNQIRIPSNKFLLGAQSEFFRKACLFNDGTRRSEVMLNHNKDIPMHTFNLLHEYVFTSKLSLSNLTDTQMFELFELAVYYQFSDIIETMTQKISQSICLENYWDVLQLATKFDSEPMILRCAQFITNDVMKNKKDVNIENQLIDLDKNTFVNLVKRETFYYVNEIEVLNLVKHWLSIHPNASDSEKKSVLSVVRLPLLNNEELVALMHSDLNEFIDRNSLDKVNAKHYRSLHPIEPLVDNCKDFKYDAVVGIDFDENIVGVKAAIENSYAIVVVVIMREIYRINHISFKFRDFAESSYKIEVSVDKQNWKPIVNYSRFRCHGKQKIYFNPTQAKFIKMIGLNFVKPRLQVGANSSSSSLIFLNVEEFRVSLEPKPQRMTDGMNGEVYLIADTNIAHLGKGQAKRNNYSIDTHALMKEKYSKPFRFNMDLPDEKKWFVLHLPQPIILGSLRFLLYDRENEKTKNVRTYGYRVQLSIDDSNWETVCEHSDRQGWQSIKFDNEKLVLFIRVIPTDVKNYNERKVFAIVHFECPDTSLELL